VDKYTEKGSVPSVAEILLLADPEKEEGPAVESSVGFMKLA
jgi:hypothetical protein